MTHYERMISGLLYDPTDKQLSEIRLRVRDLANQYNATAATDFDKKDKILSKILGSRGKNVFMEPNIRFDYGCNTHVGNNFYSNYDCKIIDVAQVKIGNDVMFGPNVTLATPNHPLVAKQRTTRLHDNGKIYDLEFGRPITIGDNVWLAANVVVNGGVTIGEGSVIGSGSVVTRDIPSGVIAVGNPCRVLRKITDADLMDESYC